MAQQNDRKYIGSGKKVGNYDLINVSICVSDIPKDEIREYKGKKYLNITVGAKRAPDQFGKTHSVWINDFKPDKSKAKGQNEEQNQAEFNNFGTAPETVEYPAEEINPDDIPF